MEYPEQALRARPARAGLKIVEYLVGNPGGAGELRRCAPLEAPPGREVAAKLSFSPGYRPRSCFTTGHKRYYSV